MPDLVRWLQDKEVVPHAVYMRALDLVYPREDSTPVYSLNQLMHKYAKSE